MLNFKAISRNVGLALLASAFFMFLSIIVSVMYGNDSALTALVISFLITASAGAFPFIFVRKATAITLRDGYVIIVLSWLLSFIFGSLPFVLWGGDQFTVMNAWFESVSGFTTTGATILEDIEALPHSLLFWRSSTHFIGGLGVVVFLLLIIPNSSPIRMRLTNMELSSLSKDTYHSRANKTVFIFSEVYLGLTLVAFVAYLLAGMTPFDAINHAFSVCATGGFSTKGLSIASFDSRLIEGITMFFMFAASIHFGLIYSSVANRSLKPFNNPVLKFYALSLVFFTAMLSISLKTRGVLPTWHNAIWDSAFQTLAVASTTGFATVDNAEWPMVSSLILFFMTVMCGCAGSTTGGVKADRVLVFIKTIGRQIKMTLHPSNVMGVRLGGHYLKEDEIAPHILYLVLFSFLLAISVLIALILGISPHNAFAGSLSSMSNVGPAIQELGTMGSFNTLPSSAKLLFTIDMFLGRIEIYPALAVAAMLFNRKKDL
ncbi:MAG: TrkH family potassium uptake protein [Bacteroidales bacterium]|nr:TrkH family potassium uptake protein [Bacteroidales bacterium]